MPLERCYPHTRSLTSLYNAQIPTMQLCPQVSTSSHQHAHLLLEQYSHHSLPHSQPGNQLLCPLSQQFSYLQTERLSVWGGWRRRCHAVFFLSFICSLSLGRAGLYSKFLLLADATRAHLGTSFHSHNPGEIIRLLRPQTMGL